MNSPVLIDSSVLLDVISEDPVWSAWSSERLVQTAASAPLVINPIIYAEVSVRYSRIEDVDVAVPPSRFHREGISYEAAFLAGKAHLQYRRGGGTRGSPLPDFFIGAHAALSGLWLRTQDSRAGPASLR